MEIRFEASDSETGQDDLGSLLHWLSTDESFGDRVHVVPVHQQDRSGEMSDTVTAVLTVLSSAAAVGELALALVAWRDSRRAGVESRILVSCADQDARREVLHALGDPAPQQPGGRSTKKAREAHEAHAANTAPIDPKRSACVLIGVDAYTNLEPLMAVRNNLMQLREALSDEEIFGLPPERLRVVQNPQTSTQLVDPIYEMAELAEDTLIVYYAGHGLIDLDDDRLYLTLPGSTQGRPHTSTPFDDVRRALRSQPVDRRVVILDCCYAGKALNPMSADGGVTVATSLSEVRGSYLMTATPENRKAHAPDRDSCTVFTGALVDVLREGIPGAHERLTLSQIFQRIRDGLRYKKWPEPQQQDRNGVGEAPFVRNRALVPTVPPGQPAPPPVHRGRRFGLVAGGLLLAFLAGMALLPGMDWWEDRNYVPPAKPPPEPAGGACSKRAELLSYSDDLDKKGEGTEDIEDLSALGFVGPSKVLALTDNDEARVFPISLGPVEQLRPKADTAQTLRDQNGDTYFGEIDGEALVVEDGTGTMLIGSEVEPSVRRYQIDTGEELGQPLRVPETLRTAPTGTAQIGRTIEALAASPDGRYLYAGWESPLSADGDKQGRNLLRIQRYRGTPGGRYVADWQYAYQAANGLHLAELAVIDDDRLLALERHYIKGIGNAVRLFVVPLDGKPDVTSYPSLHHEPNDIFVDRSLLFDLGNCPSGDPGQVAFRGPQTNPLLGNVEGMALGEPRTSGRFEGWRPLYLVTDDNDNREQITRFYGLMVDLGD